MLIITVKLTIAGLLKIKLWWNKGFDVIVSVHDVTNKILSRDSNYIVNGVMGSWPQVYEDLTRFELFCGGITLKFCTRLAKGLKIKVKNILVAKCYVCRIYRGKMEGSLFTNNNLSVFSRLRTEYWEILRISLYSVRMQENKNKKHSE